MKRKFLVVFLAIVATLCLAFGLAGCSLFGGITEGGGKLENTEFTFIFNDDGTYSLTGISGRRYGDIVIPSEYEGKPVTSIGDRAFEGCSGLTSIDIPDSVTSIGKGAFSGCWGLEKFIVDEGNTAYSSQDGVLYDKAQTQIIEAPKAIKGAVTIPDSVTSIGDYAFRDYSGLTSVTIGSGVTSIGDFAFFGCSGLTSVTIGSGVTSIGNYAFEGCSGLTSIDIPDSVTEIGSKAFYDCTSLTKIEIPDSVTSIGEAFYNTAYYNNDENWNNDVLYIGNFLIKAKRTISGSCSIREGTKIIAEKAFELCNVTSVVIPDSVTSIGAVAFDYCFMASVTIGSGVTSIGSDAFRDCLSLQEVHITDLAAWCGIEFGDNPLSHAHHLFMDGEEITKLKIPDGVTSIGYGAFRGWGDGLTSIFIPDSVNSIGEEAFSGCDGLTSIVIPDSVNSIGDEAFYDCWKLTSVTIGNGVTSIGNGAFKECSGLTEIKVDENNKIYHSQGNCLIETQSKTLIAGCKTSEIPDDGSVTSIGEAAFYGCRGLTSVNIPNGLTSIGDRAFYGCRGLTSVNIPNGLTSIGDRAFYGCHGLTSVNIPNGLTSIGNGVFYDCSGLTSIDIPDSVTSIGDWAFHGCRGLTSIVIPDSVTWIGDGAFERCSGLKEVHFENPNGWKVSQNSDMSSAEPVSGLDDPATAAEYLTDADGNPLLHSVCYWRREG